MKVLSKRKKKKKLCIFSVPYHGVPYPWYEVHILTRSYQKTSSNFSDYVSKWDVDNSSWNSSIFPQWIDEEKTLKSFVFRPLCSARRFTVDCKEYGNTLFSYFDIFMYVSSNLTFDSRISVFAVSHSLQLHTCFINFDLVKFRENWGKKTLTLSHYLNFKLWCTKLLQVIL